MTDTVATPATTAPKAKTIADDMTPRRIFDNITAALPYLQTSSETFTDWATTPLAAPGLDAEGNFDSAVYTDQTQVMVSVLRRQGAGVKAVVIAPVPTMQQVLDSEPGKAWLEKIMQKELNHVAVRHLRTAEDVTAVLDQIPTTLEGYITSGRESGGGILETFDELYKLINATLSAAPVWAKARFTKGELKKSLESKGYAAEYYPAVEDYKGKSLFGVAIELGISAAKRKGLDPTIFERWAATRDAKQFDPATDESDEDQFDDLDSLTDAMLAEPATPAAEPAAEADAIATVTA